MYRECWSGRSSFGCWCVNPRPEEEKIKHVPVDQFNPTICDFGLTSKTLHDICLMDALLSFHCFAWKIKHWLFICFDFMFLCLIKWWSMLYYIYNWFIILITEEFCNNILTDTEYRPNSWLQTKTLVFLKLNC